ncbi:hypothetical protein ACFQVC_11010 [Streptomyces monticola]|uniref:Lipoprotein n=1 Tax=Streptomyces monticola TaxID=2666263 RepID=A0ABW2JGQ1_9ACTN
MSMLRRRIRMVCVAGLVAGTAVTAAGCSDSDGDPSSKVSQAASAASSVAGEASSALSSATAAAKEKLDKFKDGIDAKGDVKVGGTSTDGDGRTTAPVTATNGGDKEAEYMVQVNFRNADKKLLDTVVVTVPSVKAGGSGEATARSTHKLSGDVTAEVGRALRH